MSGSLRQRASDASGELIVIPAKVRVHGSVQCLTVKKLIGAIALIAAAPALAQPAQTSEQWT